MEYERLELCCVWYRQCLCPTVNLSTLDGTNGFRLDGEAAGDYSGYSVSSAGDINGDGYDDLIIGALVLTLMEV